MMTPWGRGAPVRVAVLVGEIRVEGAGAAAAVGGGGRPLVLRLVRGRKVFEVAQDREAGHWPPLEFPATLFQRAGGLQPKGYEVEVFARSGDRRLLLASGHLDLAQAVTYGLQGRMEGASLFWRDGSAVPVSVPLPPPGVVESAPAADGLALAGVLTFRARAGGSGVGSPAAERPSQRRVTSSRGSPPAEGSGGGPFRFFFRRWKKPRSFPGLPLESVPEEDNPSSLGVSLGASSATSQRSRGESLTSYHTPGSAGRLDARNSPGKLHSSGGTTDSDRTIKPWSVSYQKEAQRMREEIECLQASLHLTTAEAEEAREDAREDKMALTAELEKTKSEVGVLKAALLAARAEYRAELESRKERLADMEEQIESMRTESSSCHDGDGELSPRVALAVSSLKEQGHVAFKELASDVALADPEVRCIINAAATKIEDLEDQLFTQEELASREGEQASEMQSFFLSTPAERWEVSAGPTGRFIFGGQEQTEVNNSWTNCLLLLKESMSGSRDAASAMNANFDTLLDIFVWLVKDADAEQSTRANESVLQKITALEERCTTVGICEKIISIKEHIEGRKENVGKILSPTPGPALSGPTESPCDSAGSHEQNGKELMDCLHDARAELEVLHNTMVELKRQHEIDIEKVHAAILAEESSSDFFLDGQASEIFYLRQERETLLQNLSQSNDKIATLIHDFEAEVVSSPQSPFLREIELVSALDRAIEVANRAQSKEDEEDIAMLRSGLVKVSAELEKMKLSQNTTAVSLDSTSVSITEKNDVTSSEGQSRLPQHLEAELQELAKELQTTTDELSIIRDSSDASIEEAGRQVEFYSQNMERLICDKTDLQQENTMLLEELMGTKIQMAEILEDYDRAKKKLVSYSR